MAQIVPVEIDGKHYVSVTVNNREIERRGGFATADEAEIMARQLTGLCQVLFRGEWPVKTADPPAAKRGAGSRRYG